MKHRSLLPALVWACAWSASLVGSAAAPAPTPEQVAAWVKAGDVKALTAGAVTFAQVSDTHTQFTGTNLDHSPELVTGTLQEIEGRYGKIPLVAITGDNVDSGGNWSPPAQAAFLKLLAESPLPTLVVPGNVDKNYSLGTWTPSESVPSPGTDKGDWFFREEGDNLFIFLDSVWPRSHEGALRLDELAWVHEVLAAHADKNVFLLLHHGRDALFNREALVELLQYHRPRYRQIVIAFGHRHANYPLVRDAGILWLGTGALSQDGSYRMFHVRADCIITYALHASAWEKLKAGEATATAPAPVLVGAPEVIPTGAVEARPLPPEFGPQGSRPVWRGNLEALPGEVLRLTCDSGIGHGLVDSSGYANNLYSNGLFRFAPTVGAFVHRFTEQGVRLVWSEVPVWLPRGAGFALRCGLEGARGFSGVDSYTLSSPCLTNRLTVRADVNVAEQPLGFPYGILGKGTYELALNKDGTAQFTVQLRAPGQSRQVCLTTPGPLTASVWQRLTGTFDGNSVRLYVDGKLVAEEGVQPEERLVPYSGALLVAYGREPQVATSSTISFLLDDLRVSNQVEKATAAPTEGP